MNIARGRLESFVVTSPVRQRHLYLPYSKTTFTYVFRSRTVYHPGRGTNFDLCLSLEPYFMSREGMGNAMQEIPPRTLQARPTPIFRNMGLAASVRAHAMIDLKVVFTDIALAA
jgi:hypothetical protein